MVESTLFLVIPRRLRFPGRLSGRPGQYCRSEPDGCSADAKRRSERYGRVQLRQGNRIRPKLLAVAFSSRLQHQRQHQAVRSLQPAERDAAVSDWPVVEELPAGAVPHAYSWKEQV